MKALFLKFAYKIKKGYTISLYRSPSQRTHNDFDVNGFLRNFEQVLCDIIARNQFFVLITDNLKFQNSEMVEE